MVRNNENLEALPTLPDLMKGPVTLDYGPNAHRQLRAAGAAHKLRLRLLTLDAEGDGAEWESYRKSIGTAQVVCPECENSGGPPDDCELCKGRGIVRRELWDEWFFAEKGCKDYKPGCELKCKLTRCVRDTAQAISYDCALGLEVVLSTGVKAQGNSIDGFKVKGLCSNPAALLRFLDIVVASLGVACIDAEDED